MYPVLLYSGRLVARTPAFQVGEAGSKPVRSTKFLWAISSVGRTPALQVGCRGFESHMCPPILWIVVSLGASWFAKPVYFEKGNSSILFLSSKFICV